MSPAPRILFVAEPQAALAALEAVRVAGPVQAQLAPTADALRRTLVDPDAAATWDAVVFVPGGPVEEVEVAVYVPDGVALIVVDAEVPLLLTETAARAVPMGRLGGLLGDLASASRPEPPAEDVIPTEAVAPVDAAMPPPAPPSAEPSPATPTVLGPVPEAPVNTAQAEPATADEVPAGVAAPAPVLAESPNPADRSDEGAADADRFDQSNALADHLPIGLYRSTTDGRILYANDALAELLGAGSTDELRALDVRTDLGYPREAFAREMAEGGAVRNLVQTWTRHDGRRIATRENARIIRDADGRILCYEGTMEDVTAEVAGRAEEQAAARRHRAVAAFASAAALAEDTATIHCAAAGSLLDATGAAWACLMIASDGQNRIVATAGALPDPLGRASATGDPLALCVPADAVTVATTPSDLECEAAVATVLAEAGAFPLASVPVRKAGAPLGVLVWGGDAVDDAAVRSAEALAWHVGGHVDRAEALRVLRDTEASLAVIAEHTPHVPYRLRYAPDGVVFDYLSPAIETLTGYSRDEIEARGGVVALVRHREVIAGALLADGPADDASHYHAVYKMETAHGERWVENRARPWCDGSGPAVGLVGMFQDITDRKLREDRLADAAQAALARQRALVDLAHLTGSDAFGAPAAAVSAATLGASAVSFWRIASGRPAEPLYAPPALHEIAGEGVWHGAVAHVVEHRALAIADVETDPRVAQLGLTPFVRAYGLRALLVAPVRREGRVVGLVVVHRTDEAHAWDPGETEFAAAVADAVALALEREEREAAVAALTEAREAAEAGLAAAERLNQLRTSFLANMSHEIRTPLTGILGAADMVAAEAPAAQDLAELIGRNGRRLLDTLDAVLDLSLLEAGELVPETRPVSLAAVVEAAAAPAAARASDRDLRFDFDLDSSVAADIDPELLAKAVAHLVGNAVKFTEAGGVLVSVEGRPDEAIVRVADTGPGISQAFLPDAVEAFRQEDGGHARRHEGAGLGLTLALRLVDLLGGRLELASEQPGGTVATVTFARVPRPDALGSPAGDGLGHLDAYPPDAFDLVVPAAATADTSADLLGDPFDFSFLDAPASPPETSMFDFRFGRSDADEAAQPAAPPTPAFPPAPAPPAARPEPAHEPAGRHTDEPVMIVRAQDPSETIPEAGAPPEDAEIVADAGDGRSSVLVVEDNDDTRMLLERILRSTYDVVAVGDARSALLAMNQRRFSGLVLDINLGGKETGADVLRIARSLPRYDDVFAIALTAYALPGDRERLLASGFDAYISKPFTRTSLMESLAAGIVA